MNHLLAYIDPGSGSLIIQAVIATIVAVPFFFRQQIAKAVATFRRKSRDRATAATEAGASTPERDA